MHFVRFPRPAKNSIISNSNSWKAWMGQWLVPSSFMYKGQQFRESCFEVDHSCADYFLHHCDPLPNVNCTSSTKVCFNVCWCVYAPQSSKTLRLHIRRSSLEYVTCIHAYMLYMFQNENMFSWYGIQFRFPISWAISRVGVQITMRMIRASISATSWLPTRRNLRKTIRLRLPMCWDFAHPPLDAKI